MARSFPLICNETGISDLDLGLAHHILLLPWVMGSTADSNMPPSRDSHLSLRWCWHQFQRRWHRVTQYDNELHKIVSFRFPKTVRFMDTLLQWLYDICISPAFAIILSLLLVGLVLSEIAPLIISLSVVLAWWVAVLSVAKASWVNRLNIVRRLFLVLVMAFVMAGFGNWYIKFCLASYYRHHPVVATETRPAQPVTQQPTDSLFFQRLGQLQDDLRAQFREQAGLINKGKPSQQGPNSSDPHGRSQNNAEYEGFLCPRNETLREKAKTILPYLNEKARLLADREDEMERYSHNGMPQKEKEAAQIRHAEFVNILTSDPSNKELFAEANHLYDCVSIRLGMRLPTQRVFSPGDSTRSLYGNMGELEGLIRQLPTQ
jgi:hypothetical protein